MLLALGGSCGWAAELRVREEKLCTLPPEAFERSVAVSPDFTRAAFACQDNSGAWVVVNGVASKKYPGLLAVPPLFSGDGSRVAFVAVSVEKDRSYVVVDGKEWPKVERVATTNCLAFSPDGKHLAFVGGSNEKAFVMLDGVAGPPYEEIGALRFSREGNRLAYVATPREGKQLVVVDGQPSKEYEGVRTPVFSPDGKHLAFVASRDQEQFVVLDGKEQKAYPRVASVKFSSDSAHLAYQAERGARRRLVVDGMEADFRLGAYIIADHSWKDGKTVQTALARGKTLLRVEVTVQE